MPHTGLFSLKDVANLLDQPVTEETIKREDREVIRGLLERHVSLGNR